MSMEFTLNDLQRQRVEDHLALVEQVLRRSIKTNETVDGMGHDDLYQEGCIALCRAAVSYFTEKSLHRYRFSTIAWCSMNSSLNTFRRQEQRRQSHEFSYQAAHPPPDDAFDALRARLLLHDLFLLADKEQALLIRHRLHGCSLAETARREGMSVKRVRHRLKALYRAYFAQEETKQKEL